MDRRHFLTKTAAGQAVTTAIPKVFSAPLIKNNTMTITENTKKRNRFRPKTIAGFGGVALGNEFQQNPDIECIQSVEAAWNAGIRYFDTSPWYGLGISERRMGLFLKDQPRDTFTLSKSRQAYGTERGLYHETVTLEVQAEFRIQV